MFAAFFLKEKPVEWKDRPKLTPMSYVRDFAQQPMLLRIAMAYFLRAFTRTAVVGSIALYAIQTLGFTEKELGRSWGLMPVIALASGIPLGLLVERFAKHRVLQSAFSAVIVGCIVGYFSGTTTGLSVAAFCFGFGDMMLEVTHKAFMSEHYPKEQIGQLTGAVNIFYATGRTAALVFMGFCIKWVNPNVDCDTVGSTITADYHIIWIVSGLSALMGILILSTVRDLRHEKVKR
jgi:MFS family permease